MKENQKAFELVKKMVLSSECWKSGSIEPAKECAIVAVETILNFQENLIVTDGSISYEYWKEVKEQIKLIK